jgi:hypothetical protein
MDMASGSVGVAVTVAAVNTKIEKASMLIFIARI